MAIKYNGIEIPNFVKVNNIVNSVLPSISQSTKKINNKDGQIDYGTEIGTRSIQVSITIIANDITDLRVKVRELAEWLYYEEAKKLVILEEEDIFYMAKATGDSILSEILSIGKATISFICHDPFAYNMNERNYQFMPTEASPYGFENNGNYTCYPRMEFEFTDNAHEFSIVGNDEYLYFGNPQQIDLQTPIDANPLVMNEAFANLNGWTNGISLLDGGVIDKEFTSNGYSIRVSDWGNTDGYTGWFGASKIKSLPYLLNSFKTKFRIGLHGTKIEQLGRIHLYFLDVNGQRVSSIEFRDGNVKAMSPYARWIVGNKEIIATYGKTGIGYWTGFLDGYFDVARRKNADGKYVWAIWIARYEPKTKTTHHSLWKEWVDIDGIATAPIASVQIHIGAYKQNEAIPQMYIQHLSIYDEDPVPNNNEIPYIFKQGDILMVDSSTGQITLNGEDFYHNLDPASKFIKFRGNGINGIWVSPFEVVTNGRVTYRERWL